MNLKANEDPVALRKQLIQMRMELNRQKIRRESLVLLEPVEKLRSFKQRLSQGATPLLVIAGATLTGLFLSRNRSTTHNVLPILKIAASALPLFFKTSSSKNKATTSESSEH